MKSKFKLVISFIALVFLACEENKKECCAFKKDSTNQPVSSTIPNRQIGYIIPGLNHGFEQSPININSSTVTTTGKHKITLYYKDKIKEIENLGHTVQLDFDEGSSISVDDTIFNFKQCHFHTPSEHLIDGVTFPMEMHIVNMMPSADSTAVPQYMVIAVLFKEGRENAFITDFLNLVPKGEYAKKDLTPGIVKLSDLFGNVPKEVQRHFYEYRGSLTTPPYTESVRWYVLKHVFEASPEQIEAINKIEGDNARHVNGQYGRMVSSN